MYRESQNLKELYVLWFKVDFHEYFLSIVVIFHSKFLIYIMKLGLNCNLVTGRLENEKK